MPLKISRILHAGYVFEHEGVQIALDPLFEPVFSRNCHAYPAVEFDLDRIRREKFAAVFISHHHDDHFSLESLRHIRRETPIYMYCVHEELFDLIRALGFSQAHSLDLNIPVNVGPFEVIPRRALDADLDSMFQIRAAGCEILNVVDSWIDESTLQRLAQIAPWDLVLWPFQTMREIEVLAPLRGTPTPAALPPEWIEQLQTLRPRFVVPSSCQFRMEEWSWYNHAFFPISYTKFQHDIKVALPETQVVRLDPSKAIYLKPGAIEKAPELEWVNRLDKTDVDYAYHPDKSPPPTAEISQRFPSLNAEAKRAVFDYCNHGLVERYKQLDPTEENFFSQPRIWELSLFDHKGMESKFLYRVGEGRLELIFEKTNADWRTEIPLARLHGALFEGETLISLYLRVQMSRDESDPLEDPLIRCLYNEKIGTYQKAQLKKIQSGNT